VRAPQQGVLQQNRRRADIADRRWTSRSSAVPTGRSATARVRPSETEALRKATDRAQHEAAIGAAIGAVAAQAWSTGAGDAFAVPSLAEWKATTGLPWFGFWARELLRWGTHDPFVAFALSPTWRRRVRRRSDVARNSMPHSRRYRADPDRPRSPAALVPANPHLNSAKAVTAPISHGVGFTGTISLRALKGNNARSSGIYP
jgi:hypothetical protein